MLQEITMLSLNKEFFLGSKSAANNIHFDFAPSLKKILVFTSVDVVRLCKPLLNSNDDRVTPILGHLKELRE